MQIVDLLVKTTSIATDCKIIDTYTYYCKIFCSPTLFLFLLIRFLFLSYEKIFRCYCSIRFSRWIPLFFITSLVSDCIYDAASHMTAGGWCEKERGLKISKTRIEREGNGSPPTCRKGGMKELAKEEKVDDDGNISRIILCWGIGVRNL